MRLAIALLLCLTAFETVHANELASWNDGASKQRILNFVQQVEKDKIALSDRIAVFDNDGTLWGEQPMYFQALFAMDRVKAMAPQNPEWQNKMPYKAILENDHEALKKLTQHDFAVIIATTHSGMTPEEFAEIAKQWLRTAKHPHFNRLYKDCVYQPMLELLTYLRAHGFKTFIVSGGGIDFIRAFAEDVYGIPTEQVIGSSGQTEFQIINSKAELVKLPKVGSVDDGNGKPVNINLHIGRRPILAFGNSDGDLQMLQYTSMDSVRSLGLLLHHDDSVREYAYDRQSSIGKLDKALDAAQTHGWQVVSMKNDFKVIFP